MTRETTTTVIGSTQYTVTQIGAKAARRIEMRCARLLVAGLKVDDIQKGDTGAIEALMSAVANGMSDEDLDMVCDVFAQATMVSLTLQVTTGTIPSAPVSLAAVFDDHFSGANHINMWKWLIFCFKFNFASFLGELGALLQSAPANGSERQKGQTPQSGVSSSLKP
jgi:hypothetical protein